MAATAVARIRHLAENEFWDKCARKMPVGIWRNVPIFLLGEMGRDNGPMPDALQTEGALELDDAAARDGDLLALDALDA